MFKSKLKNKNAKLQRGIQNKKFVSDFEL